MAHARSQERGARVMIVALVLAVAGTSAMQSSPMPDEAGTTMQESDEPVVELGPGITPPRVIHQVMPDSNSGARGFRVSGVVLIGLVVSSGGLPREVHVVRSLDQDLDQSTVEAVQQWRFEPAQRGDNPVAVRITVEIRFRDL